MRSKSLWRCQPWWLVTYLVSGINRRSESERRIWRSPPYVGGRDREVTGFRSSCLDNSEILSMVRRMRLVCLSSDETSAPPFPDYQMHSIEGAKHRHRFPFRVAFGAVGAVKRRAHILVPKHRENVGTDHQRELFGSKEQRKGAD